MVTKLLLFKFYSFSKNTFNTSVLSPVILKTPLSTLNKRMSCCKRATVSRMAGEVKWMKHCWVRWLSKRSGSWGTETTGLPEVTELLPQTGTWNGSNCRGKCLADGYTTPSSHKTCSHSPLFQMNFPHCCSNSHSPQPHLMTLLLGKFVFKKYRTLLIKL